MRVTFENIADLRDPRDQQGRSYREVNSETKHNIAVGQLVELSNGARLFVAKQTRDCDGTPLYSLAPDTEFDNQYGWSHGYSEEDLNLV